jgi:hypothetical protein
MHLKIKTAALFVVGIFIAANSHAQSLTNGLVAYYPFSGNANDASGNGLNGIVNGATLTTDRFGNPSSAYSFNGSSSYISIASNPLLKLTTNLTISIWMNRTSVGGMLLCKGNAEDSYSVGLTATGAMGFNRQNNFNMVLSSTATPSNAWVQVVCTLYGTNASIYFNGQFITNGTGVTLGTGTGALTIGEINSAFPSYYGGSLDDIRIYNRALSSDEVAQLYAIESGQSLSLIKAVTLQDYSLDVGTNYQLQVSSDLINWTNQGAVFTATSSYWLSTNYWNVANWNQLFFRVVQQ